MGKTLKKPVKRHTKKAAETRVAESRGLSSQAGGHVRDGQDFSSQVMPVPEPAPMTSDPELINAIRRKRGLGPMPGKDEHRRPVPAVSGASGNSDRALTGDEFEA